MTAKEHFLQVEDKQLREVLKPSTHSPLDAKPPIDSTLKSLATPNTLDESELRKKANGLWDKVRTFSTKLNDECYGMMLDFAKYYHSIQAKEQPKEGKFIVGKLLNEAVYFESLHEAIEATKNEQDTNSLVFKLVAEVEKVTTINVKEV